MALCMIWCYTTSQPNWEVNRFNRINRSINVGTHFVKTRCHFVAPTVFTQCCHTFSQCLSFPVCGTHSSFRTLWLNILLYSVIVAHLGVTTWLLVTVPDRSATGDPGCCLSLQLCMEHMPDLDSHEILWNIWGVQRRGFFTSEKLIKTDFGVHKGIFQMGHFTKMHFPACLLH